MVRIERAFDAAMMALAYLAAAIIALITLAIPVDATLRFVLARSIYGLNDLAENGLMTAVFLSAPWVLSRGGHVAVDLLTSSLPAAVSSHLLRLTCIVGLVFSIVFAWASVSALMVSHERGMVVRKVLNFPEWWTFVPIVVCFVLCSFEFARQLVSGERPTSVGNR